MANVVIEPEGNVKKSLWRELVMDVGLACLMVSGLIVGKQYFNQTLHEIEHKTDAERTKDP